MAADVRVFISHSSKEDELSKRAVRALEKRLDTTRIRLLYDKDVLDTGEHWRDELWEWWGSCDAAVVICSVPALTAPWVFLEVATLMRRHSITRLPVFPVLIDPVTAERVKTDALFKDQLLPELQATRTWTEATLDAETDALAQKLNVLAVLSPFDKPLFEWERRIAVLLQQHATPELIRDAAVELEAAVEPWMPLALQARVVARAMINAQPVAVTKAMRALAAALDEKCRSDVMGLVAAAWLPAADAQQIAAIVQRPRGTRGVALPTHVHRLACWYIRRASGRYPEWQPVEFKRPSGADDVNETYDSIAAALRGHLKLDPDHDDDVVVDELQRRETRGEPVFIVVPADAKEPPKLFPSKLLVPLMKRLLDDFPSLSFFVLAGHPPVELQDAVAEGRVIFLNLDREQSKSWDQHYADAVTGV
jgi:hypothetical protein